MKLHINSGSFICFDRPPVRNSGILKTHIALPRRLFPQERRQPAKGLRRHGINPLIGHKAVRLDLAMLLQRIDQYMLDADRVRPS